MAITFHSAIILHQLMKQYQRMNTNNLQIPIVVLCLPMMMIEKQLVAVEHLK